MHINLLLLFLLSPTLAHALAGFAERSSTYHYNHYAKIERGHPSDLCMGENKWCLRLVQVSGDSFEKIDTTFNALNVPEDTSSPYLFGHRYDDSQWVIYDLKNAVPIHESQMKADAMQAWLALGQAAPLFIDARNTDQYLTETKESIQTRQATELNLWFMFTLVPLSIMSLFLVGLSYQSYKQYQSSEHKRYRLFAIVFLLPVLWLLYVMFSSLLRIYL